MNGLRELLGEIDGIIGEVARREGMTPETVDDTIALLWKIRREIEPTPKWREEFPEFPALGVEIPAGFTDVSWHNDECPSWQKGGLLLYVDHPDPEEREVPRPRFALVATHSADGCEIDHKTLIESDDWSEILAKLREVD